MPAKDCLLFRAVRSRSWLEERISLAGIRLPCLVPRLRDVRSKYFIACAERVMCGHHRDNGGCVLSSDNYVENCNFFKIR